MGITGIPRATWQKGCSPLCKISQFQRPEFKLIPPQERKNTLQWTFDYPFISRPIFNSRSRICILTRWQRALAKHPFLVLGQVSGDPSEQKAVVLLNLKAVPSSPQDCSVTLKTTESQALNFRKRTHTRKASLAGWSDFTIPGQSSRPINHNTIPPLLENVSFWSVPFHNSGKPSSCQTARAS